MDAFCVRLPTTSYDVHNVIDVLMSDNGGGGVLIQKFARLRVIDRE